jgi:hypothetical protein
VNLNLEIVEGLRKRYPVHPLIFHRSCERAENETELFDILDTFVDEYPIVWDEENKRWFHTDDLFQTSKFGHNE